MSLSGLCSHLVERECNDPAFSFVATTKLNWPELHGIVAESGLEISGRVGAENLRGG
jgi:hypothetical protein